MIEGFVHLKANLPKGYIKEVVKMGFTYSNYARSILFTIDETKTSHDVGIKEFLLEKFSLFKSYVDKIVVFVGEDKSKTLIFNY